MRENVLFLFLAFFTLGFVACSDDDDIYQITDTDVNGVYSGTLDVDAPWREVQLGATGIKQKIYITKTGENRVKLELKNFVFNNIPIGTIEVPDIVVNKLGETFDLQGNGVLSLIVGQCAVTVKGTITPEGDCHIVIDVQVTEAGTGADFKGLNVNVDFTGEKMATDKSSEAKITNFKFVAPIVLGVDMTGTSILFYVEDLAADLNLTPTFDVSAGATVTPASGVIQDFSKPVTYTVVSEDGIMTMKYTVTATCKGVYDFEEWMTVKDETPSSQEEFEIPVGTWGSTNNGIMTLNTMFEEAFEIMGKELFEYPVAPTTDAKNGQKGVVIKTLDTFIENEGNDFNAAFGGVIPYNTAGSLFLGTFKTEMDDMLSSTKFGVPFSGEPVKFSGWYKYTPGLIYRDNKNKVVADKTDELAIYALLYEAQDGDKDITLIGGSIKPENKDLCIDNSPYVVLRADLTDASVKTDWTYFELSFKEMNNKKYDSTKKYKLALVCTSSKEGATYNGAPGSVLTIDNLTVVYK